MNHKNNTIFHSTNNPQSHSEHLKVIHNKNIIKNLLNQNPNLDIQTCNNLRRNAQSFHHPNKSDLPPPNSQIEICSFSSINFGRDHNNPYRPHDKSVGFVSPIQEEISKNSTNFTQRYGSLDDKLRTKSQKNKNKNKKETKTEQSQNNDEYNLKKMIKEFDAKMINNEKNKSSFRGLSQVQIPSTDNMAQTLRNQYQLTSIKESPLKNWLLKKIPRKNKTPPIFKEKPNLTKIKKAEIKNAMCKTMYSKYSETQNFMEETQLPILGDKKSKQDEISCTTPKNLYDLPTIVLNNNFEEYIAQSKKKAKLIQKAKNHEKTKNSPSVHWKSSDKNNSNKISEQNQKKKNIEEYEKERNLEKELIMEEELRDKDKLAVSILNLKIPQKKIKELSKKIENAESSQNNQAKIIDSSYGISTSIMEEYNKQKDLLFYYFERRRKTHSSRNSQLNLQNGSSGHSHPYNAYSKTQEINPSMTQNAFSKPKTKARDASFGAKKGLLEPILALNQRSSSYQPLNKQVTFQKIAFQDVSHFQNASENKHKKSQKVKNKKNSSKRVEDSSNHKRYERLSTRLYKYDFKNLLSTHKIIPIQEQMISKLSNRNFLFSQIARTSTAGDINFINKGKSPVLSNKILTRNTTIETSTSDGVPTKAEKKIENLQPNVSSENVNGIDSSPKINQKNERVVVLSKIKSNSNFSFLSEGLSDLSRGSSTSQVNNVGLGLKSPSLKESQKIFQEKKQFVSKKNIWKIYQRKKTNRIHDLASRIEQTMAERNNYVYVDDSNCNSGLRGVLTNRKYNDDCISIFDENEEI